MLSLSQVGWTQTWRPCPDCVLAVSPPPQGAQWFTLVPSLLLGRAEEPTVAFFAHQCISAASGP